MKKAADQENTNALENMGIYYLEGYPVEQDFDQATRYFKAALKTLDLNIKSDEEKVEEINGFLRLAAKRGLLEAPLSVRSKGSTIILDPGTYVIYLADEKKLLYPFEANFNQLPSIRDGETLSISISKEENHDEEDKKPQPQIKSGLTLLIESDFVIRTVLLDGADLRLSEVTPGDEPHLVKTKIDVSLSADRLNKGFLLKIHTREGREHLRLVELHDGELKVVTPTDMQL